jgi:hypothetical protein
MMEVSQRGIRAETVMESGTTFRNSAWDSLGNLISESAILTTKIMMHSLNFEMLLYYGMHHVILLYIINR